MSEDLIKSIIKIVTNAPNENIRPYLDSVTDEQILRANKKVYKLTKKNIIKD